MGKGEKEVRRNGIRRIEEVKGWNIKVRWAIGQTFQRIEKIKKESEGVRGNIITAIKKVHWFMS